MNTDVMFSSKTDQWSTPQDFYDKLNAEFRFTLDAAADDSNHKCDNYYTAAQDGLKQPWAGTVWCNPPYGRSVGRWVEKAFVESLKGATVVMLLPCRPDVAYFHDYILPFAADIRYIRGRLKFSESKNSAPFPSMVVVFRRTLNETA